MAQPKDFGFRDDEKMLRDSARKFLAEHCSVEKLRALVAGNPEPEREPECSWDVSQWHKAVELGWTALAVPERAGGAGMSMVAVAALSEEVGRAAWPSPLAATIHSTLVLRECDTDDAEGWLGKIAEGESMSLAITNAAGSWDPNDTDVTFNGGKLTGTASFVQDARKVRSFLVAAREGDGVSLHVVSAEAAGVKIEADRIVDLSRDQARVTFDGAEPAATVSHEGAKAIAAATPAILATISADLVGSAEWLLQTATEYAKVREQFGRPIGFFQAVKHGIVNVMIEIDKARSLVYREGCDVCPNGEGQSQRRRDVRR
jgi:alkylation response protein AidB-like acyl-CoA dehydrogenase